MQDCKEGFSIGPFHSEQEVSALLGCQDWIPTERFPRVQPDKVRAINSATDRLVNPGAQIKEDLQLTSTDEAVAVIRKWLDLARKELKPTKLMGWVLDEAEAYRQIGIRPELRKYAVVVTKCPDTNRPAFVIMIGHSFGVVAAVYNYNRRSAVINDVLNRSSRWWPTSSTTTSSASSQSRPWAQP